MKLLQAINMHSLQDNSLEELMAEYAIHQKRAVFDALYARLADDLFHYLVSLSDRTTASDIAQVTWLKVYEKPQAYHASAGFKAWLFKVARHALVDEFRKQNRMTSFDDGLGDSFYDGFGDGYGKTTELNEAASQQNDMLLQMQAEQDMHDLFDAVINAMPKLQCEAFCLQQEGFSLEQISHITHCPKETIKTRLRYARQFLSKHLNKTETNQASTGKAVHNEVAPDKAAPNENNMANTDE